MELDQDRIAGHSCNFRSRIDPNGESLEKAPDVSFPFFIVGATALDAEWNRWILRVNSEFAVRIHFGARLQSARA